MVAPLHNSADDPNRIIGSPTKEFFIYMLTKDIGLVDAISELVDNCVDGARRLRPDENYTGLSVRLTISQQYFQISDNCGGIRVDIARKYAFRFGKPYEMERVEGSIGNFGVGMKRALFKMGSFFKVESTTETSCFVVEQDIQRWAEGPDDWDFRFKEVKEGLSNSIDNCGTTIKVEKLYQGISDEFGLENFQLRLKYKLQSVHQKSIEQGLSITLNGLPLTFSPAQLLSSAELKPAYEQLEREDGRVKIKLYAGVAEPDPKKAGWNIFCNGRLILEADKSSVTGWGRESGIPEYHNDYARFRGYVFFDAEQSDLLPWNTTKNSVDADSPLYRSVKLEMIKTMKPAIDFLKELSKEKSEQKEKSELDNDEPYSLELALQAAQPIKLSTVEPQNSFSAPTRRSLPPTEGRIQYSKPLSEIDKVKLSLNVTSLKAVGERTFEYYLKMECED